jgi:hypothetical protein
MSRCREYTLAKCSTGSRQENVRRVIQSIEHGMELLVSIIMVLVYKLILSFSFYANML